MASEGTLSKRMDYVQSAIRGLTPIAEKIEASGQKIARVNIGDPVPYFGTPKYVLKALAKAAKESKTGYSRSVGEAPFLEAIARRYKRLYSFEFNPDHAFVGYGVSELIQFLDIALMETGKGCIMFSPYYPSYIPFLKLSKGKPYFSLCTEGEGWAPDMDGLKAQLKKAKTEGVQIKYLHVINPCNPTGAVVGRKRLQEIADLAKDEGLLLVSDEIYDEMVFGEDKFVSMCEVAKGQPLMILNGLSKNWCATGLRVGWAIIHGKEKICEDLRDAFTRLASIRLCSNTAGQYAGVEALNNVREHKKFITGFNREVKKRSDYCWKRLNEIPGVSCQRAKGAFYLFPKIDLKKSGCKTDKDFVQKLLEEEHVWAVHGSGFGVGGHIRIVTLGHTEVLEKACAGIERLMKAGK